MRPQVLFESGASHEPGSELHAVWIVRDLPAFWEAPPPELLASFREQLREREIDTRGETLLRQTDTPNNALVLANFDTWVRPIRCIEALLFAAQNARIPILDASTEFAAFILRSADDATLKIYFYTRNVDGIGNVARLLRPIEADIAAGWRLEAALHNHNFHPGHPALNGAVAPSAPDATLFQNLAARFALREGWITNGIDTSQIPASAFPRLSGEADTKGRP